MKETQPLMAQVELPLHEQNIETDQELLQKVFNDTPQPAINHVRHLFTIT